MFIQILDTPNPNTMKFAPGMELIPFGQTMHFESIKDCANSPLARLILEIASVERIMIAHDFIAVTKKESADWHTTKTIVVATIIDYISAGQAVVSDNNNENQNDKVAQDSYSQILHHSIDESVDPESILERSDVTLELIQHILALIDEKVRPAVAMDGGDVSLMAVHSGVVYLKMRGACSGCPSSTYTLKNGIENMLRHYIPEITAVENWDERS